MKRIVALVALAAAGLAPASDPDPAPAYKVVESTVSDVTMPDWPGDRTPWNLGAMNVPAVHDLELDGDGFLIAVIDTGVDNTHRDLRLGRVRDFKNLTEDGRGQGDPFGHGTHVASIAAAARNGTGLLGVAPGARILDVRVLDASGRGSSLRVADGIDFAVRNGADVINLSLGSGTDDPAVAAAVRRAEAAGVVVVAAAGNEGAFGVAYPAAYPTVVAVGAVDQEEVVSRWSSRGDEVFCVAPGVKVPGAYPGPRGGLVADFNGTSMAAPHVAGLAALWLSANPDVEKTRRPALFRKALASACKDLGDPGRDASYGHGLPDALKVVGK